MCCRGQTTETGGQGLALVAEWGAAGIALDSVNVPAAFFLEVSVYAMSRRKKILVPLYVRADCALETPHVGADYTPDELEFLLAMDSYCSSRNRRFPTYREVLAVLLALGYRKDR